MATPLKVGTDTMHNPQTESFVIQVRGSEAPQPRSTPSPKFNFSAMKLFHRFRKILTRVIFPVPSPAASSATSSRHRHSDRFEPPKTSCSSYYSSYSHYNEAISDCIEFFNKSAQDGFLDTRKSDVV